MKTTIFDDFKAEPVKNALFNDKLTEQVGFIIADERMKQKYDCKTTDELFDALPELMLAELAPIMRNIANELNAAKHVFKISYTGQNYIRLIYDSMGHSDIMCKFKPQILEDLKKIKVFPKQVNVELNFDVLDKDLICGSATCAPKGLNNTFTAAMSNTVKEGVRYQFEQLGLDTDSVFFKNACANLISEMARDDTFLVSTPAKLSAKHLTLADKIISIDKDGKEFNYTKEGVERFIVDCLKLKQISVSVSTDNEILDVLKNIEFN